MTFFNLVNLIESGGSPFNHSLNMERDAFESGKGKYLLTTPNYLPGQSQKQQVGAEFSQVWKIPGLLLRTAGDRGEWPGEGASGDEMLTCCRVWLCWLNKSCV